MLLREYVAMTVFEVLADPGRREILRLLLDGERSVGSLVADLSLAQPNVSKHLKVLRQAGFVDVRPNARERLYRLQPEPLQELDAWLNARGVSLVFAEMKDPVRAKIERYELTRTIDPAHFLPTLDDAVAEYIRQTGAQWRDPQADDENSRR